MSHCLTLSVLILFLTASSPAQQVRWFPPEPWVAAFPADNQSHVMRVDNLIGSRDLRAVLGGTVSVFEYELVRVSAGASAKFEVHPNGSAQIVSTEYRVDYATMDVSLDSSWIVRGVVGHTSHHLSDNWYYKLGLTEPVNYSRDYLKAVLIRRLGTASRIYAGLDYGYVFHLERHFHDPWRFQLGFDAILLRWKRGNWYAAGDVKFYQEAGFKSENNYQAGYAMAMGGGKKIRFFYQYRHGLDERGQFFPRHSTNHAVGLFTEL